jgi:hypothetical protein
MQGPIAPLLADFRKFELGAFTLALQATSARRLLQ